MIFFLKFDSLGEWVKESTCLVGKTTLWAVNSLGRTGQRPGFGIGNNTRNTSSDWTFVENANEFTVRRLYILVRTPYQGSMILVR